MTVSAVLRQKGDYAIYWCQGCEELHSVRVAGSGSPAWGYNGTADKPTFTPSVLIRSGHYMSDHKPGDPCWCTYNAAHPEEDDGFNCAVCHTFVTDGMVQFLSDCTHKFAGQTVPLPPLPDHLREG